MNELLYSFAHHKNKSNIIKNTGSLAINKKYILITGGTNYLKKLPNRFFFTLALKPGVWNF